MSTLHKAKTEDLELALMNRALERRKEATSRTVRQLFDQVAKVVLLRREIQTREQRKEKATRTKGGAR